MFCFQSETIYEPIFFTMKVQKFSSFLSYICLCHPWKANYIGKCQDMQQDPRLESKIRCFRTILQGTKVTSFDLVTQICCSETELLILKRILPPHPSSEPCQEIISMFILKKKQAVQCMRRKNKKFQFCLLTRFIYILYICQTVTNISHRSINWLSS